MDNVKKNIARAFGCVAPPERVLLTLRWGDGLADAEIAAATGRPQAEIAEALAKIETRIKEKLR